MKSTHRNLRKAALLVASLDEGIAAALLAEMSAGQAQAVRQAIECLGEIDPDEQNDVIEEFFRIGPLVPVKQPSGIELDDRLPNHLSRSPRDLAESRGYAEREPLAFRCLHEASVRSLAPFLEREHPQTVAVVVSHLPADRAAEILGALGDELQIEVARRLVDLDETNPEILRDVEHGLESWLGQQAHGERRRTAGLTALANILGAADPRAKEHILANLARHDRQLAARLEAPARAELSFAQIEQLDVSALKVVLHHAPRELLVLALAGAGIDFSRRVFNLMGPREAAALESALCNLGPTRLSDVEDAQRELADLARQLERRGEIVLDPGPQSHLSVAV